MWHRPNWCGHLNWNWRYSCRKVMLNIAFEANSSSSFPLCLICFGKSSPPRGSGGRGAHSSRSSMATQWNGSQRWSRRIASGSATSVTGGKFSMRDGPWEIWLKKKKKQWEKKYIYILYKNVHYKCQTQGPNLVRHIILCGPRKPI